ncbi:NUDIX hydrolase [Sediminibacillus albus]|uniref:8-oxo-dGTP pyrophosphatase MutT, NUDIX family n=1 Tax=Sediminibacillus albus TaxID=407036 RepID=A0A1G8WNP8_9BACI|nr:CoA pyrophosphatase [Sediminibacillus albus]SDJ79737.1 8-oxo-dGTP pyrophosphatase MutT, NUDIX family [Sediminibacillus albus]
MKIKSIVNKIGNHTPAILSSEQFAKFAVLLPLIEKNNDIHLLFEVRSHKLRRQPGDICFPGGKMDPHDKTAQATAIRETTEELGISGEEITDVHPIDYLVSPFGMLVYPFVGVVNHSANIEANPEEVEEVFTVPLAFFQDTKPEIHHVSMYVQPEDDFPYDLVAGGQDYEWRPLKMEEYFYMYDGRVIWGLTARIAAHFAELIKER